MAERAFEFWVRTSRYSGGGFLRAVESEESLFGGGGRRRSGVCADAAQLHERPGRAAVHNVGIAVVLFDCVAYQHFLAHGGVKVGPGSAPAGTM